MKVRKADVWSIVKQVMPNYTGRKFFLNVADHITFSNTNWCEGTRTYYAAVQLREGGRAQSFAAMPAPWNNPIEGQTFAILPGVAVVTNSIFCGHDCGITVYVNPQTAEQITGGKQLALPEATEEQPAKVSRIGCASNECWTF